jgi:hypothetical protein
MTSNMNIIVYLNKNNIKWFPISLSLGPNNYKKEQFTECGTISYQPKYEDFKNLTTEELLKRQSIVGYFQNIAIDTSNIHQIDVDDPYSNKFDNLNKGPCFKSIQKRLPHYFVKFDKNKLIGSEPNKIISYANCKMNSHDIKRIGGGDILLGSWSWCQRDELVWNADCEIPNIDVSKYTDKENMYSFIKGDDTITCFKNCQEFRGSNIKFLFDNEPKNIPSTRSIVFDVNNAALFSELSIFEESINDYCLKNDLKYMSMFKKSREGFNIRAKVPTDFKHLMKFGFLYDIKLRLVECAIMNGRVYNILQLVSVEDPVLKNNDFSGSKNNDFSSFEMVCVSSNEPPMKKDLTLKINDKFYRGFDLRFLLDNTFQIQVDDIFCSVENYGSRVKYNFKTKKHSQEYDFFEEVDNIYEEIVNQKYNKSTLEKIKDLDRELVANFKRKISSADIDKVSTPDDIRKFTSVIQDFSQDFSKDTENPRRNLVRYLNSVKKSTSPFKKTDEDEYLIELRQDIKPGTGVCGSLKKVLLTFKFDNLIEPTSNKYCDSPYTHFNIDLVNYSEI